MPLFCTKTVTFKPFDKRSIASTCFSSSPSIGTCKPKKTISASPLFSGGGWKLKQLRVCHDCELICNDIPGVWLKNYETFYLSSSYPSNENFVNTLTRTYNLGPRTNLRVSDLTTIQIDKAADNILGGGGWNLGDLTLLVNGTAIYDNLSINTWLRNNTLMFTACTCAFTK